MSAGFDVGVVGTDVRFPTDGSSTILAAGLRAGVVLPHECASGSCGACKARLASGEVTSIWSEAPGLSERDRRKGDRVLLCQSVATADCVIRVPLLENEHQIPALKTCAATVAGLESLNAITAKVTVRTSEPLDYRAGQFVLFEFADGVRRAYSMSRPAGSESELEFVVRSKPGGAATAWIFDVLQPGDSFQVEGPYGRAFLQSPTDRPIIAVAGGSGLGPMVAIVEQAVTESSERPVHLYFGNRRPEDMFLTDRLAELSTRGVHTHVVVEESAPTNCRSGSVVEAVIEDHQDLTGFDLYMAGPPGMIDACLLHLVRSGLASADRVFFDRFQ